MNKLHLGRFLSLGCFSDTEGWITQNVLQMDEKTGTKHVPDSASVADLISLKYKKLVYFITPLFTPEVQYPIIHLVLFSFEFSNNHLSLNRISLLVVTGAQCSRKKEKKLKCCYQTRPMYLSLLWAMLWPLLAEINQLIHGLKKEKKHDCLCFLLL